MHLLNSILFATCLLHFGSVLQKVFKQLYDLNKVIQILNLLSRIVLKINTTHKMHMMDFFLQNQIYASYTLGHLSSNSTPYKTVPVLLSLDPSLLFPFYLLLSRRTLPDFHLYLFRLHFHFSLLSSNSMRSCNLQMFPSHLVPDV